ncbi:prophage MuSo1 DNA transposition protein putative [Brachyspira sp. CAG:484]|nr:prophage MuSo1 DNA transposition protein putative [Brachyspira sp. CAG:484]
MHKLFVKTRNVKNFIGLMNNLIDKSNEVPKMGLIYGDPGLGKTQTAVWWATNNDAVYVRAQNKMTCRWLLEKIVYELGESPSRKMADLIEQCITHLRLKPQVIIIDEVDYLINRHRIVETLRDLHDLTGVPIVLIGMQEAKTKLGKYRHLYDRISEIIEFKPFSKDDMDVIVEELSEIKITDEAKEIFFEKTNRFRQVIKGISLLENLAKTNGLNKIDVKQVKGLTIEK